MGTEIETTAVPAAELVELAAVPLHPVLQRRAGTLALELHGLDDRAPQRNVFLKLECRRAAPTAAAIYQRRKPQEEQGGALEGGDGNQWRQDGDVAPVSVGRHVRNVLEHKQCGADSCQCK